MNNAFWQLLEHTSTFGSRGITLHQMWHSLEYDGTMDKAFKLFFWQNLTAMSCFHFATRIREKTHIVEWQSIQDIEAKSVYIIANDEYIDQFLYSNRRSLLPALPDNAVLILEKIAQKSKRGITQAELSDMLKMDPRTTYHHVETLSKYHLIVKFPVVIPGIKTNMCVLPSHAEALKEKLLENNFDASSNVSLSMDYVADITKLLSGKRSVISYSDIKANLNIDSNEARQFNGAIRKACHEGILSRVFVKRGDRLVRCLRLGSLEESEEDSVNCNRSFTVPLQQQIFNLIEESKEVGVIIDDFMQILGMNRKHATAAVEMLMKSYTDKIVKTIEFPGNCSRNRYFHKDYSKDIIGESSHERNQAIQDLLVQYVNEAQVIHLNPNFIKKLSESFGNFTIDRRTILKIAEEAEEKDLLAVQRVEFSTQSNSSRIIVVLLASSVDIESPLIAEKIEKLSERKSVTPESLEIIEVSSDSELLHPSKAMSEYIRLNSFVDELEAGYRCEILQRCKELHIHCLRFGISSLKIEIIVSRMSVKIARKLVLFGNGKLFSTISKADPDTFLENMPDAPRFISKVCEEVKVLCDILRRIDILDYDAEEIILKNEVHLFSPFKVDEIIETHELSNIEDGETYWDRLEENSLQGVKQPLPQPSSEAFERLLILHTLKNWDMGATITQKNRNDLADKVLHNRTRSIADLEKVFDEVFGIRLGESLTQYLFFKRIKNFMKRNSKIFEIETIGQRSFPPPRKKLKRRKTFSEEIEESFTSFEEPLRHASSYRIVLDRMQQNPFTVKEVENPRNFDLEIQRIATMVKLVLLSEDFAGKSQLGKEILESIDKEKLMNAIRFLRKSCCLARKLKFSVPGSKLRFRESFFKEIWECESLQYSIDDDVIEPDIIPTNLFLGLLHSCLDDKLEISSTPKIFDPLRLQFKPPSEIVDEPKVFEPSEDLSKLILRHLKTRKDGDHLLSIYSAVQAAHGTKLALPQVKCTLESINQVCKVTGDWYSMYPKVWKVGKHPLRQWISLSGKVNESLLLNNKRFVLDKILRSPGISEWSLHDTTRNCVTFVELLDILEMLESEERIKKKLISVPKFKFLSTETAKEVENDPTAVYHYFPSMQSTL